MASGRAVARFLRPPWQSPLSKMSKVKRAFVLQMIGLGAAGIAVVWMVHHFDLVHVIERAQHKVGEMETMGAVAYPFLLAACNLLLLPGGVIAMGAGLFFGLWWGVLIVLIGNVLGAAAAFQISRRLGRQWIERKMMSDRKWFVLDEAIAREGWKIIFLSQVHPLFPTSLLNYLYGVTRIRFWPCMLWVAVGQLPGLFLYTYLGTLAQLGIRLWRGKSHPLAMEYVIWFGGLIATLVVTIALGRVALRMMSDVEREALEAAPPVEPERLKQPCTPQQSALTVH
jgi:uncharacterized membrane protein YdjX (TVP38/TMEM64 family)